MSDETEAREAVGRIDTDGDGVAVVGGIGQGVQGAPRQVPQGGSLEGGHRGARQSHAGSPWSS